MMKTLINEKKFMKKGFTAIVFTVLIFCFASAQKDSLYPLNSNPKLFSRVPAAASAAKIASAAPLSLPFFDDFAQPLLFPDTSKWMNDSTAVFLNTTYPRAPFTIGVVTFDGLNVHGYPYNIFAGVTSSAGADTLTSRPIDLSVVSPGDTSVYLSFFYQARGLGDAPETADSLVLEFFKAADTTWNLAWSKAGFNPGVNDSAWKLVMVNISNADYFNSAFQFRFRNRATVSGSLDHWHVDYVYLNRFRTSTDTLFQDYAFGYEAPSLLRNYSAMPYWQMTSGVDVASTYPVFIRNNVYTQQAQLIYDSLVIYDQNNTAVFNSPFQGGGSFNVDNFLIGGWDDYAPHANIPFSIPTPVLTDSGTYTTKVFLRPNDNNADGNWNDVLNGKTHFHNYYAYDDGTAEAGYGLNTYGAMMAVKFSLNVADTLKAVDIYFDPVTNVGSLSFSTYSVTVWSDNGGIPGNIIYQDTASEVEYITDSLINSFVRDTLKTPLQLNPGVFYVGIQQTNNVPLNVGFDRNYNHKDKMFYNTSGNWANSSFDGSYMIRPVMWKLDLAAGLHSETMQPLGAVVFPNPARSQVTISHSGLKTGEMVRAQVIDLSGRVVLEETVMNNQPLDVSGITNGVYLLRISDRKTVLHSTKLFIAH